MATYGTDEIERRFQNRAQWSSLPSDELHALLLTQAAAYGESADGSRIPRLAELVRFAATRLAEPDRLALVQELAATAEGRRTTAAALWPVIMADPAHGVVSTAALNYAVLVRPRAGDPLTGARHLLEATRDAPALPTRVGVLSGLLLLGDRRVTRLLHGCWSGLDPEAQVALTHARSGYVFAAMVEFYMDWLDALDDRRDDTVFGAVAAVLTRLPSECADGHIYDIQRHFPVTEAPPGCEVEPISRWSVSQFGALIRSRLQDAYEREHEPRVLHHALRAWGLAVPHDAIAAGANPTMPLRSVPSATTRPAPRQDPTPQQGARSSPLRALVAWWSLLALLFVGWNVVDAWLGGMRGAPLGVEAASELIQFMSILVVIATALWYPEYLIAREADVLIPDGRLRIGPAAVLVLTAFVVSGVVALGVDFAGDTLRRWLGDDVKGTTRLSHALRIGFVGAGFSAFRLYMLLSERQRAG